MTTLTKLYDDDDTIARLLQAVSSTAVSWRGDLYVANVDAYAPGLHRIRQPGFPSQAVIEILSPIPMRFVLVHNDSVLCGSERGEIFVLQP